MLILNVNTAKHSEYTPLSAYHLGIIQKVCSSCGGRGGALSLKSELKRTGRGEGVKPICTFALSKKLPDFQAAGRILSDNLLGSC